MHEGLKGCVPEQQHTGELGVGKDKRVGWHVHNTLLFHRDWGENLATVCHNGEECPVGASGTSPKQRMSTVINQLRPAR